MHAFRLGVVAAAVRVATDGGGGGGGTVDPLFGDVQLLLHGDSGTVLDSSSFARTATVSGSITNSTAVTGYLGASQLLIAAGASATWSGLRFTTDGTYTFECFITIPTHGSPRSHVFGSWSGSAGWTLDIDNGGGAQLAVNGALASGTGTALALNPGVRYHIALVLTIASGSTTASYYVNGVLSTTFTGGTISSRNSTSSAYDLRLGNRSDNSLNLAGYIDEFRVTNGARYTGAFTAPTAAFPDTGPPRFSPVTGVTLTTGNTVAQSTSGWNTTPVSGAIPSTGKTFIEFTVSSSGAAMLGVMVGNTPVSGNYLGQTTNQVSNGDQLRNGGGAFTTSTAGDLDSTASSFGVAVDQTAGTIRWYKNGTLQSPTVTFTPGTAGLYFAAGLFAGRGTTTVKSSSTNTPSGFTYHAG